MDDWRGTFGGLLTLLFFGVLFFLAAGLVAFVFMYLFLRFQLRSPESATRYLNSHPYLSAFALKMKMDPDSVAAAHCPHSGGVNIVESVAYCSSCGQPWLEIHQQPALEAIPLPVEIRVRESPGRLTVTVRRW